MRIATGAAWAAIPSKPDQPRNKPRSSEEPLPVDPDWSLIHQVNTCRATSSTINRHTDHLIPADNAPLTQCARSARRRLVLPEVSEVSRSRQVS